MIDVEKWVIKHLGRKALFKRGRTDIVCRIVGYDMLDYLIIVEIIDKTCKATGWNSIDANGIIMLNCDNDVTFWYVEIDDLYLQPKSFELPAMEMLDALDILTQNFSMCTKATEDDRKLIRECISNLKAKIYELK